MQVKQGELIRHKVTREPYLVINKLPQGLLVVNLTQRIDPAIVEIILPRAEKKFEPDFEFVDMTKEEATVIKKQLSLVESIQKTVL